MITTTPDFWTLIEGIGWGTKTTDYNQVREFLYKHYTSAYLKQMHKEATKKRSDLAFILSKFEVRQTGAIGRYWNVGDDGFWDLTAHIVGLGKEMYEFICNNPIYAKTIKYKENFEYSFSEPDNGESRTEGTEVSATKAKNGKLFSTNQKY